MRSAWARDEPMLQKHTQLIGSHEDIAFNCVTQIRSPKRQEDVRKHGALCASGTIVRHSVLAAHLLMNTALCLRPSS